MLTNIICDFLATIAVVLGLSHLGAKLKGSIQKYVFAVIFLFALTLTVAYVVPNLFDAYTPLVIYASTVSIYALLFKETIIKTFVIFLFSLIPIIVFETLVVVFLEVVLNIDYRIASSINTIRIVVTSISLLVQIIIKVFVPFKKFIKPIEKHLNIVAFVFVNLILFMLLTRLVTDKVIYGTNPNTFIIAFYCFLAAVVNLFIIFGFIKETNKARKLEKFNEFKLATLPLVEANIQLQHDYRNHLNVIKTYLSADDRQGKDYIKEVTYDMDSESEYLKWNNPIFGALIQTKRYEADIKEINFETISFGVDNKFPIEDYDLMSIVSNLLDNAFEAVSVLPKHQRKVSLSVGCDGKLYISVANSGTIDLNIIEKMFTKGFSTKGEKRGMGLYSLKQTVKNSNGDIEVIPSDNMLEVKVIYQYPKKEKRIV